jgi:signal transduction histidine kinase
MSRQKHDINLGPRLTAAFLAVALLAFASGLIGLIGFQWASSAAGILVQDAEMIQYVQEIRVAVAALPGPAGNFLLTENEDAHGRFMVALDATRARLADYASAHGLHRHSVQHAVSAHDVIADVETNVEMMAQLEAAIFDADGPASGAASYAELQTLVNSTTRRLDQLSLNATEDIESAKNNHSAAERSAFIGLTASAVLAISLALGLALVLTRSISVPLAQLAEAADGITDGDLSSPVSVSASGEIGRLADAFERMRQTLVRERGQLRLLAVLEERDRIGREMHDGLAQVLGYVNAKAQAVGEFLKSGEPSVAERHIVELVGAAREAYTDAREAIVGLRLDGVGQRGLAEMLAEYVEQFTRRNEIAAELMVAPSWNETLLSATARFQLLRIVQEALTNVRKHSSANLVGVSLEIEEEHAIIEVEDDGHGFNLSLLLRPGYSRYGLRTMRERAQAIGGKFRIESSVGNGTCIIVRLLLEPQGEEGRP